MAYTVDANIKGKYLVYKEKPLVREGNMIYYGNMEDSYVLCLMILNDKAANGGKLQIPGTIMGQIWSTDSSKSDTDRVVKQFFGDGLAQALDLGIEQLDRYIKKSKS